MGIMQGVKMAGSCKDYRSWHLENLKDPVQAAYYMLAALEESVESDKPMVFFKTAAEVSRANSVPKEKVYAFFIHNLAPEDRCIVTEMVMRIMEKQMVEHLTSSALEPA